MRTIFVVFIAFVLEIVHARYVQNEETFTSGAGLTNPATDDTFSAMDSPRIRIHINTDGGNGLPYIFLRRRPNTSMRLRIQQRQTPENKPIRIVYRNAQETQDFVGMEGRDRQQAVDPRILINSDSRRKMGRIILNTRGASRIRFSPRNF